MHHDVQPETDRIKTLYLMLATPWRGRTFQSIYRKPFTTGCCPHAQTLIAIRASGPRLGQAARPDP